VKLARTPALIAVIGAVPFVTLGLSSWFSARAHQYQGPVGFESALLGDMVFMLGAPLTLFVLHFPQYTGRFRTRGGLSIRGLLGSSFGVLGSHENRYALRHPEVLGGHRPPLQ
jgi:hypothetical protein